MNMTDDILKLEKKQLECRYNSWQSELELGVNVHQLENSWKRIIQDYAKYGSGLTILVDNPWDYHWTWAHESDYLLRRNLPSEHKTAFLQGEFFISKKGTKCFRVKKHGKHLLIRSDFGGPRGREYCRRVLDEIENPIYFRAKFSNGGGQGVDYVVVPNEVRVLREEDI